MENHLIETIEYRNFKIKIYSDFDAKSPREWDNLGIIACKWGNHNLGDEQIDDPINWLTGILDLNDDQVNRTYNKCNNNQKIILNELEAKFHEKHVILTLYVYEHSGITMNTGGFSCPWDSGKAGYIYVSHENIRKDYGWKNITIARIAKIEQYLKNEVVTYAQYLEGDVYGFVVENGDFYDSCWGFYGHDLNNNGLMDHAKESIDDYIERTLIQQTYIQKERNQHVKMMLKKHVPMLARQQNLKHFDTIQL